MAFNLVTGCIYVQQMIASTQLDIDAKMVLVWTINATVTMDTVVRAAQCQVHRYSNNAQYISN